MARAKMTYGGLPPKRGFHRHHIVPIHTGGADTRDNVVYLTPDEHAAEHKRLYEQFGRIEDLASYQMIKRRFLEDGAFNGTKWWVLPDGTKKRSVDKPHPNAKNQFVPKHGGATTAGRSWYHNPLTKEQKMVCEAPDGWVKGRLPGSVNPNRQHVWWNHPESGKETHSKTCPGDGWVKGKIRNFFVMRGA